MPVMLASRIMRTTINIADPVLAEVRREQAREGKALGDVVSELLAEGLAARRRQKGAGRPRKLRWVAKNLRSRIDLRDKEALWLLLDREEMRGS
jgi:Arc/MetJ family transcription regulator